MRRKDKPQPAIQQGAMVAVYWLDAYSQESNESFADHEIDAQHAPSPIVTIGYLLRANSAGATVACEFLEPTGPMDVPTWRGLTFIPAGMVQRVVPLRDDA